MKPINKLVLHVLSKYDDYRLIDSEDLSDEGFSGAYIFKVNTVKGKYILKGYQTDVEKSQLKFVHDVSDYLNLNGYTEVPKIIRNKSNKTITKFEGRFYELVTFASGKVRKSFSKQVLSNFGIFLANLHKHLHSFPRERIASKTKYIKFAGRDTDLMNKIDEVNESKHLFEVNQTNGLIIEFLNTALKLYQEFGIEKYEKVEQNDVVRTIIHRDLWGSNIFFNGGKPSGLIDWLSVREGARLDDISKALIKLTKLKKNKALSFIQAYHKTWSLNTTEIMLFVPWLYIWNTFQTCYYIDQFLTGKQQVLKKKDTLRRNLLEALEVYKNLIILEDYLINLGR